MIRGSNLKTSSFWLSCSSLRVDSERKRRLRTESGSAGSWVMKSHVPPKAFFLVLSFECRGWERIEIRPEQELVVK